MTMKLKTVLMTVALTLGVLATAATSAHAQTTTMCGTGAYTFGDVEIEGIEHLPIGEGVYSLSTAQPSDGWVQVDADYPDRVSERYDFNEGNGVSTRTVSLPSGGLIHTCAVGHEGVGQWRITDLLDALRAYNPYTGEHVYTTSENEIRNLTANGWVAERAAWQTHSVSERPIHRLYNPNAEGGDHHYTLDTNEISELVRLGWIDEGVCMYADAHEYHNEDYVQAVYRLYNPNAKSGAHLFTTNFDEVFFLCDQGWLNEGVSWFVPTKTTISTN